MRGERVEEVVGVHNVAHHGVQVVPVENDDHWSALEAHHHLVVAPPQGQRPGRLSWACEGAFFWGS